MGDASMRASDHQVLLPLVVSVVAADAKYKADDTALGFKPVRTFTAAEAAVPPQASCKMQRPG
jgi:branched-chain amino acid transport system substrate-binding protein